MLLAHVSAPSLLGMPSSLAKRKTNVLVRMYFVIRIRHVRRSSRLGKAMRNPSWLVPEPFRQREVAPPLSRCSINQSIIGAQCITVSDSAASHRQSILVH